MKHLYLGFLTILFCATSVGYAQMPCTINGDFDFPTQASVDVFATAATPIGGAGCTSLTFTGTVTFGTLTPPGIGADQVDDLAIFGGADPIVIGGDLIISYTNLQNLINLGGLIEVGGDILIANNGVLEKVAALGNLNNFGGALTINSNATLNIIDGLNDLGSITALTITNNNSLDNCSITSVCDYVIANAGSATISNNGGISSQCTSEPQVREICTALPVTLTAFTAKATEKVVQLDWATSLELDNEGFVPQRSTNGTDWTDLGFVTGNGTQEAIATYSFADRRALAGTNYYRLKQMDYGGDFAISEVVVVEFSIASGDFRLFPNPANDELNVRLALDASQSVVADVYNLLGRKVLSQTISGGQAIDISSLATGTYLIRVNAGTDQGNVPVRRFQKL